MTKNHDMIEQSSQVRDANDRSPSGGSKLETLVIVGALLCWFVLMRWVLPRMGVPT